MITEHRVNHNHNFNWKDVKILDKEPSYNKRLISEMIYLKRQKISLNRQNDIESLSDSYQNILQSFFLFVSRFLSPSILPLTSIPPS